MIQYEYKLNDGTDITLSDMKIESNEKVLGDFTVQSIPVITKSIAVFDDSYDTELDNLNEIIASKNQEINDLQTKISQLRNEIDHFQNMKYDIVEEIDGGNKNNDSQ
jgi:hypothetical protein